MNKIFFIPINPKHSCKFLVCALIIVYLLLLCGCGRKEIRLIQMLPSNSNMIVIVNWSAVRQDAGLKKIINARIYEEQLSRFGIDEAKVDEIILFETIRTETQGGLLVHGSFDSRTILTSVKSRGWSEETIDGRKVYSNNRDFVALPSENTIVAGTREGVAAAFRTLNNAKENLSTSRSFKMIKAALSDTKSPVSAFLLAPDGSTQAIDSALSISESALSLFDAEGIAQLLKKINLASGAGLTIARGRGENCVVKLSVLMRDEKSAAMAADSLNILKELSITVSSNTNETQYLKALKDLNVTRNKEALLLKMQMPDAFLIPPISD